MSNNSQKTPQAKNLNLFAEKKIADRVQIAGKSLPCSVVEIVSTGSSQTNAIVKVNLEVKSDPFTLPKLTVPVFGFEYIRYPIQVGDKGVVVPVDVLIGSITGLGSGTPSLVLPANLTPLWFMPVGNANWSETDDPNAILFYGPNGFILRDVGKNCSIVGDTENITVTAKTQITLQVGSNAKIIIKDGEVDINATTIKFNGIVWDTHEHTNVQSGSSKTGGPTAP